MLLYSTVINALSGMLGILDKIAPKTRRRKFFRFVGGQRNITKHIIETYQRDPSKPTVWIHAASFGEYSVARPLITAFKQRGMQTVVTFFSPTGYEAVDKNRQNVDYLYYLPFDTRANARAFLDTVRPDKAVFIVSEYWFNYLDLLREKGIDTYLVSAHITRSSVFFKWYGKLYQRCLKTYKKIFAVDETSVENLRALGYDHAEVSGNPLFDNAIEKAQTPWADPIIERFANGRAVFIAGSIHDERDLKMVTDLANLHPEVRFLLVPHEISAKTISAIKSTLRDKSLCHSECDGSTDFADVQSLIIDSVGSLAYIYRYAQWAYVGGGFTPYLHSLLEATVYGLPVAFGPMIHRKVTPAQIIERGIGAIVNDSQELNSWFVSLQNDQQQMQQIKEKAREYVKRHAGSTKKITNDILQ